MIEGVIGEFRISWTMRNILLSLFLGFMLSHSAIGQILVSSELIEELDRADVVAIVGDQAGPFGVEVYKVRYTMLDHTNTLDTVSGLVVVPLTAAESNLVVYCHGTSNDKLDVPSQLRSGYLEALGFSSFGFTTAAPDYPGLGEDEGFHPYINAESEALSGLYLIDIAYQVMASSGANIGGKLFLSGYSQGGHAGMALHEYLETELNGGLEVTACAFGSGPYSIGEIMRELISGDNDYIVLGFVPFFIRGQQEIYGNIYNDLSEIFKPIYIPQIQAFINGDAQLSALTINLATTMFALEGEIQPRHLLQDDIVDRLQANDPNDEFIQVMRDNDVHNYVPEIPVNLYYCNADQVVPFTNTIEALNDMEANGSTTVQAVQVSPDADHGPCAELAIPMMVDFFLGFLGSGTTDAQIDAVENIFPNPAQDLLTVQLGENFVAEDYVIYSVHGQAMQVGRVVGQESQVNVSGLNAGTYMIELIGTDGRQMAKFVKE